MKLARLNLSDIKNLVSYKKKFEGAIKKTLCDKLNLSCDSLTNDVTYSIEFYKQVNDFHLRGFARAIAVFICEVCHKTFSNEVSANFDLKIIDSLNGPHASNQELLVDCDVAVLNNGFLDIEEIVIDELYLSLPQFPKHSEECIQKAEDLDVVKNNESTTIRNPFNKLNELIFEN